mmetsp:Transcript_5940/g.14212  ORF Transcript_5940/g.14212 Transcript_5940/m.14212 type:complete len:783 (+) Transcript_5940:70-2418(+)
MAQVMGAELDSNGSAATATSTARLPLPAGETEATLFAKLVQLLGQQPGGTMLLTDLLGYLPFDPQQPEAPEVTRAARMWLQGFQGIFALTGSGDRECVTLKITSNTVPTQVPSPGVPAATHSERWSAQTSDLQEQALPGATESVPEAAGSRSSADVQTRCAVQLRGLPYRAQLRDIEGFLGAALASEVQEGGINIIYTKSNQPSGYALVKFGSAEAAEKACRELHKTYMSVAGGDPSLAQTRYIEVFPATEKIDKGRNKAMLMMVSEDPRPAGNQQGLSSRQMPVSSSSSTTKVVDTGRTSSQDQVHQDRLMKELRLHMQGIEGGQLLLSMLGVALSPESRSFLKKTNRGLKHFMAQHPAEFRIEGPKGQEKIIYVPAYEMEQLQQHHLAAYAHEQQMAMRTQCGPHFSPMFASHDFAYQPTLQAFSPLDAATLELRHHLMCDQSYLQADDPPVPPPPLKENFVPPESPPPLHDSTTQLRAPCTPQDQREHPPIGTRTPSLWGDTPYPSPDGRVRMGAQHHATENLIKPPPSHADPPARDDSVPFDFPGSDCMHGFPSMDRSWFDSAMNLPPGDDAYSLLMNCAGPYGYPGVTKNGCMGLPGFSGSFAAPPLPSFPVGDHAHGGGFDEIFVKKQPKEDPSSLKLRPQEASSYRATQQPGTNEVPSLILRGLPLTVTTQDIFSFFSKHQVIEGCSDGGNVVQIGGGKKSPSLQAIVEMKTMEDAREAQEALDGQQLMEAYVEVSINSDSSHSKVEVQLEGALAPPVKASEDPPAVARCSRTMS